MTDRSGNPGCSSSIKLVFILDELRISLHVVFLKVKKSYLHVLSASFHSTLKILCFLSPLKQRASLSKKVFALFQELVIRG